MHVKDLLVTPHLPKLVEASARNCYNSFNFANKESHQLVKRLLFMPDPHLSIGHHGNILVCLDMPNNLSTKAIREYERDLQALLLTLQTGSHGYLTSTTRKDFPESRYEAVISGNIVAWLNAMNYFEETKESHTNMTKSIAKDIYEYFKLYPEIIFFMDKEEGYANLDNPYIARHKQFIEDGHRSRIIAMDNFTNLSQGERKVHETATVIMRTSRDMSMQINRHDAGISQLSQRYVLPFDLEGKKFKDFVQQLTQEDYDKIPFLFHVPEGIDPDEPIQLALTKEDMDEDEIEFDTKTLLWNNTMTYNEMMEVIKTFFFSIFFHQYPEKEKQHKRANEQARSILSNNMDTVVYYTRSKWRWEHYLKLRTAPQAQVEARRDAEPLLNHFHNKGWFHDLTIKEKRNKKLGSEKDNEKEHTN